MKATTLLICALVALPVAIHGQTPKVLVQSAQENAAKAKKDVLMVFSASSWQNGSKSFEEKILQSEEFKKGIEKDLVQVLIPVPRTREDAHKELLELEKDYRFQTIPSVILTDSKGRPYAYSATTKEKPAEYLAHLKELRQLGLERDKMFEAGSKAEGLARAELYVKALKTLPQTSIEKFYAPELELITKADPEGKTGYVQEIQKAAALSAEKERFNTLLLEKKYDEIIKASQAERAELKGEDAQRLMMYEIQAYYSQNKLDEAGGVIEAMKKFAPDSDLGKRADQFLAQIKSSKARQERMKEAAKNPKVKVPSKPIVSKPVAIVNDINELKKDAKAIDDELAKAIANEEQLKTEKAELGKNIAAIEGELKKFRETEKKSAEVLKTAIADREKLARRSQAMKDVVENHEAMEMRKRDINELKKRATDLQKQAEELRKKAGDIKKGK
ncbi:MAG: hypothetical protein ACJAVK_001479 [Akkermansiaceae bacterium]|jgi:hypothetical protein